MSVDELMKAYVGAQKEYGRLLKTGSKQEQSEYYDSHLKPIILELRKMGFGDEIDS